MNKNTFLLFLSLLAFPILAKAQTAISSSEALAAMNMNGSYYLTADLVVDHWNPVGVFAGTLDGRGHCITIKQGPADSNGYGGLFSSTQGAEICNLTVGGEFYGITVAAGSIVARAVNTTIKNCQTEALIHTVHETALLGGLVGIMDGGEMFNSSSNAFLEGHIMGGLVGKTLNGATVKNCYSSTSFLFTSDHNESEVGFLVHTNNGTLENNYVKFNTDGWYIASIGQLEMIYGTKTLAFNRNNYGTSWGDGECISSSLFRQGDARYLNELGVNGTAPFGLFTQSLPLLIRYVHDFHEVGYNIGDMVYVDGVKTFVFYINDEGTGGWVVPFVDSAIHALFTWNGNNAVDDYFNTKEYIETMDYEYAQWHGGITVQGENVSLIPDAYENNPGKFFTYILRENDDWPNTKVNNIQITESAYFSLPSMKQLAYYNSGVISHCFYPYTTGFYGLTKTGSASQCTRYASCSAPYDYGQFGPYLYEGNSTTELAMVDSLNAWVKAQNDDKYVYWAVAGTKDINGNDPIHKYAFNENQGLANTAIRMGKFFRRRALRYVNINGTTNEQTGFKNTLAYYGAADDISVNNVSSPWEGKLFVTEDACLKGSYRLNANVMFDMDNSDASGFAGANYDWHMVSSVLSNAPVGINYQSYTNGGPFNNPSQVRFNKEEGYFPLNTPYASWDFYCYDEPNDGWPNFKRKSGDHYHHDTGEPVSYSNESRLTPGKGYLWAVDKRTGFQAYGTLNNGTVNRQVTRQGNCYPGYNLVGNPYQAYLDFDAFATQNNSMLAQSAYTVLDADKKGYVSYCPGVSSNPLYASRYLSQHQGFFIQVLNGGQVRFDTNQAVLSADSHFRGEDYPLVNLMVTDREGRRDYATVELDRPQKGGVVKMKGIHAGDAELAVSMDAEEYSIAFAEGFPEYIPVRFHALVDGDYSLRWDTHHADFGYLHLVDNLTGAEVDCLTESDYVFHATPDDYRSRFKLCFSSSAVEEPMEDDTSSFAYLSNGTLVVEGGGQLELFDLQGRLIRAVTMDGYGHRMPVADLARGVYVLRRTNSKQSDIQKIIIP